MTHRFRSIWGEGRRGTRRKRRPAAANGTADEESGFQGRDRDAELRALKVMAQRGLMSPEEYDRRRAAILRGD